MGHGNPAPYELLTGSGSMELLQASLGMMEDLLYQHRKFVFVPSAPTDRFLLTLGDALEPLELAVIDTARDRMATVVRNGHYRSTYRKLAG